ncbi:MAG TPA: phosphatase PAP2 family protein, partial [Methylomirabilota bacterium]|nr:phosphatase PAP2 family protein [Methylomirabilota bacterium]
ATFAVLVVYLVGRSRLARPWRLGIQGLALLTMMAVGLARILLGAHWPADVVTGFALGSAVAAGAAWWHLTHPSPALVHDGAGPGLAGERRSGSRIGGVFRDPPK